jgi:hypothetical protein
MQKALDDYLTTYNTKRPHQGRGMSLQNGLTKQPQQKKGKSTPAKTQNQLAA